jgi:hypothetical protein
MKSKVTIYKEPGTSAFAVKEHGFQYSDKLDIGSARLCNCPQSHLNCMKPKDWLKS